MGKVLIIDDDEEIVSLLAEYLQKQGHDVIGAHNGIKGLVVASQNKPDVIICDINMPDISGRDVVSNLRQDDALSEVPVIYLTGCKDRHLIRSSMNAGGVDLIEKPAALSEILQAVESRLKCRNEQVQKNEQRIEKAVDVFVDILGNIGKHAPEIKWLTDYSKDTNQRHTLTEKVRSSWNGTGAAYQNFKSKQLVDRSLLIKGITRTHFLKISEVKAIVAQSEYTQLHWGNGQKIVFRKSLKEWINELPDDIFIRIHRKAIINLEFLDYVEQGNNGQFVVHIKDIPQQLQISQRARANFNNCLKAYTLKNKHF